jgi:hypothetical protein
MRARKYEHVYKYYDFIASSSGMDYLLLPPQCPDLPLRPPTPLSLSCWWVSVQTYRGLAYSFTSALSVTELKNT